MHVQPLYIAAEKGQLPELKRVIVRLGEGIAMEETLDAALARVFGGPPSPAVAEAPPAVVEGSTKSLLDAAASALARVSEELRRAAELLQRLRETSGR